MVEVVSLDDPNDPWVKACPLVCHAVGPSLMLYGYSTRLKPWLQEHRKNYDVVVINGIWQYNALGVWRALRGTDTPYFVYTHGMLDPWFKRTYPLKHLKKWFYWPWADYRVLRDATSVLFTCEEERRLARESFWLYRCKEFVVNYGTAGPVGNAEQQRHSFLEKFPHLKDKRTLLFLGRVHVKKGPDLLFRALAKTIERLPVEVTAKLHLVMAGPNEHDYGQQMAKLTERLGIQDRITWTGMITGDLKWGAFYSAEAFVLPSHQENFGIAVAEALACKVPVLISDQVNIWREICNDRAGFVDTDTEQGTINLIERWLQTPRAEWELMRQRARISFEVRFSIEQAASSLVRAMEAYGLKGANGSDDQAGGNQV